MMCTNYVALTTLLYRHQRGCLCTRFAVEQLSEPKLSSMRDHSLLGVLFSYTKSRAQYFPVIPHRVALTAKKFI
jgi:hypothetical protein